MRLGIGEKVLKIRVVAPTFNDYVRIEVFVLRVVFTV